MSALSNIQNGTLRTALGDRCFSKATLAINAGAAATIKTTGATTYSVGGVFYSKAALSAQSIAITHRFDGGVVTADRPAYVQPISTTVIYVIAVNAAGTVAVVQGSYAGQSITFLPDLSKIVTGAGGVPAEPEGYTAIGAIKVVTNGSTTFTPATTALDAAGLTVTYFDISTLPMSL